MVIVGGGAPTDENPLLALDDGGGDHAILSGEHRNRAEFLRSVAVAHQELLDVMVKDVQEKVPAATLVVPLSGGAIFAFEDENELEKLYDCAGELGVVIADL